MAEEEQVIWSETASMRDFVVNVPFWFVSIGLTVGAFFIDPIYALIPIALAGVYAFIVWLKRFNSRYKLTNQRLIAESGIFSHHVDEIELYRVTDSKSYESFLDRIVGLGTIEVMSTDRSGAVTMTKVPGAREKREQVRNYAEKMKQERNFRIISNVENVEPAGS